MQQLFWGTCMLLDDKCDSCTRKKKQKKQANNALKMLRPFCDVKSLRVIQVIGFIFFLIVRGFKKKDIYIYISQSEVKVTALEIQWSRSIWLLLLLFLLFWNASWSGILITFYNRIFYHLYEGIIGIIDSQAWTYLSRWILIWQRWPKCRAVI